MTTTIELWSLGEGIEIVTAGEKKRIETQNHRGQELLRLRDLAKIFSLQLREDGSTLTIGGVRGEILITDGRPLVRSGDLYVLLSSGVWRKKAGNWYVPEDFLVKALANIVDRKIERQVDGSFQLKPLKVNKVRVRMNSYPDHLSITFEVSEKAPVQVREFRDYVEVAFSEFLMNPEEVEPSPDPRLVTAVDFNQQESLGSFRILKGSQYSSFKQYYLELPAKLIIEIYGTSTMGSPAPSSVTPGIDRPPATRPAGSLLEKGSVPRPLGTGEFVILDPGHGGIDYGVDAYQDLLEKVIAMNVARLVEKKLTRLGVRVRLTRTRDLQLPNEQRSAISNFYQCRLYLGIHLGGAPDEATHGPVVYTYSPGSSSTGARSKSEEKRKLLQWEGGQAEFSGASRRLAGFLQRELNREFRSENPVVGARLSVLAPIKAPAVVVETGFLTNSDDQGLLATPGFQEKIAEGITEAITQFLR